MIERVEKMTIAQEVYNRLLQAILDGRLQTGEQLDEKVVSEWLGISRTPLREALNYLKRDGLITEIPYKGSFVRKFTEQEVSELYEVRKTLEVMAIRLAVKQMGERQISEIMELVHLSANAMETGNMAAYSEHDSAFHSKLAEFSNNSLLVQMLGSLEKQIKLIRHMANKISSVVQRTQFDREHIIEAIQKRDEELAAKFMDDHISNVMVHVIESLRNSK